MLSTDKSLKVFFLQLRQCEFTALLVFATAGVQADDTDIYLSRCGSSTDTGNNPNLLFILDTSGSMNARDAGADKRTPRMTVLKNAMDDLLTNLDNVNVGLSRFSNSGGSVIFPVSPRMLSPMPALFTSREIIFEATIISAIKLVNSPVASGLLFSCLRRC